jgi:crotonobetainyl-CoA:carnitine CoA-transferase CaiB-like acyl-CoA transferase
MLKGIRIVEFAEGVAGPLAALRLGDLGAEVIKVECAGGDWLRGAAPLLPDTEMSAAFFELNRGKRSVLLPAEPGAARTLLRSLLEKADVFITDRTDKDLRATGVDGLASDPYAPNPRLIRVSISPWGERGPLSEHQGSELTAQAMAGYTRYLGVHGEPACRLGADVASAGTGIFACQSVLAALLWRGKSGEGQHISLSLLNSLLAMKSIHLAAQSDPDRYAGPRVGGANNPPERGWKTQDEPIFFSFGGSVGAEGRPGWVQFVEEVGLAHLLNDKRFDKNGRNSTSHGTDVHALRAEYERGFAQHSAGYLVDVIRKYAGNAAAYQSADAAIAHPQTAALGIVQRVASSDGPVVKVRSFPARFSRLRPQLKGNAPGLGEHTVTVAAEYGVDAGYQPR